MAVLVVVRTEDADADEAGVDAVGASKRASGGSLFSRSCPRFFPLFCFSFHP